MSLVSDSHHLHSEFEICLFVLENFITNPKCDEVVVYPLQDGYPIPQEEVVMSSSGFGPQNIGNAHDIGCGKTVQNCQVLVRKRVPYRV